MTPPNAHTEANDPFRDSVRYWETHRIWYNAALANVCYSAAYLGELSDPRSWAGALWRRRRAVVFVAGTLFAMLIAQYWIGDEIYPDVR